MTSQGFSSGSQKKLTGKTISKSFLVTFIVQYGSSLRIILVFDAHKLDISDEFKHAIEAIRAQDDKIRIILNKADMMNHQQLMRVYGALLWSLSKILGNPEVGFLSPE